MKFVLRVLCLPLVALCYVIKAIAMLTMKCGCYILSPALLLLGVCCVFTIAKQQWDQTLLLMLTASVGILSLIVVALIVTLTQGIASFLRNL